MEQSLRPLADAYALAAAGQLAEAIPIFKAHAETGNGDALFTLGDIYWRGVGTRQDLKRGRNLFCLSAQAGFGAGCKAYTNLLGSGHAGKRNWAEALKRLEIEAENDARRAQILGLVRSMTLDPDGNPTDLQEAEQLSERVDVRIFRRAFTAGECQFLMLVAEPSYERAGVVIAPGRNIPAFLRTADGSTLHWLIEDPAVQAMNRRIAALSGLPIENGEPLQILRYRPGQEYKPHFDWLDVGNRRVMTALAYLNDDYEGGETEFTKIGLKERPCRRFARFFEQRSKWRPRPTIQACGPASDEWHEISCQPLDQGSALLAVICIEASRSPLKGRCQIPRSETIGRNGSGFRSADAWLGSHFQAKDILAMLPQHQHRKSEQHWK